MNNYDNESLEIGKDFLRAYTSEDPDKRIELSLFAESGAARSVMGLTYDALVKNKMMPRLEEIPLDEKYAWWEEAKRLGPTLNQAEKIKLTKALYALAKMAEMEMVK